MSGLPEIERRIAAAADVRWGAIPADLPRATWDGDRVPAEWIPTLGWALGVFGWGGAVQQKRILIHTAVEQHRLGGTPRAVTLWLDSISASYVYTERPAGPFTARVEITNPHLVYSITDIDSIKRASVVMAYGYSNTIGVDVSVSAQAGASIMVPMWGRL